MIVPTQVFRHYRHSDDQTEDRDSTIYCFKLEIGTWWRHRMETFFHVTGPFCGEFTGPGEFPAQRPVTRSFDVFFDLRLNKRLSKQPWGWWFETPSWSLWHLCNDMFSHNISHAWLTPGIIDCNFEIVFSIYIWWLISKPATLAQFLHITECK